MTFLLDHLEGCTPLRPCASCVAARFLKSKLSESDFNELLEKIAATSVSRPPYSVKNPAPLEALCTEAMQLTVRSEHCLRDARILTIGDLVAKTGDELLKVPSLGRKALNEIIDELKAVGRSLAAPPTVR